MKAILVIDEMPSACNYCKFAEYTWHLECCLYKDRSIAIAIEEYTRPSWCPLRPLPPHEKALMFESEFEMFSEKVGEIVLDAIGETE